MMSGAGEYRLVILSLAMTLALGEFAWRRWASDWGYDARSAAASLGVMLLGVIPKQLGALVIGTVLFGAAQLAPWRLPADDWRVWAACFVGVEFAYYWFHRFNHTVRWFWANHAVHHSSNEFVLPSAYRLGWFGPVMGSLAVLHAAGAGGFSARHGGGLAGS